MNKTKRLLALLLSLVLLLSLLVSCGGEETPDDQGGDKPSQGDNQNSDDKPSDDQGDEQGKEEENPSRYTLIPVKNQLDVVGVTQRLFYPDTVSLLVGLETVKANIDGAFADPATLKSYLTGLYAGAQGLGIYADYIGNTSLSAGDVTYGAVPDDYAFGGGKGYPLAAKKDKYRVGSDDDLKEALQKAKSGDVILVIGDICIDMSDWILGGEVEGFGKDTGKIKYEMVIPEGVTLMGQRGNGDKSGAIIKVTSYTNIAMRLGKNARLTGLVIQGPDSPQNKDVPATNHSIGIMIDGEGARIDNCEISGFSRQAVVVKDAKNVKIDHNYFHHLLGTSGVAVHANNASVTIEYNLFSQVNTIASVFGPETEVTAINNVCVSDSESSLFLLNTSPTYDADYKKARVACKSITVKNNTFLCPADLFTANGIPTTVTVEQNLFAYPETMYLDYLDEVNSVDASIYDADRVSIKANVYNILAPKSMSKTSKGLSDDGVSLTAFVPEEKAAVKVDVTKAKLTVLSANYYSTANDNPYINLLSLRNNSDAKIYDGLKQNLNSIMTDIGGYANYLTFNDKENGISQVIDGKTYGATADDKGQIGGGAGYYQIYTEKDATRVVKTKEQLIAAVNFAREGDIIYIDENARIDLSDAQNSKLDFLDIKVKITLCSNRGFVREDGSVSTGGVIICSALTSSPLMKITAEGTRITGLTIAGPDPATHLSHHNHAFSMGNFPPCVLRVEPFDPDHAYYYNLQNTTGILIGVSKVEIDNCEVSGFSDAAIKVGKDINTEVVRDVEIHHNYIHHNQLNGLGYGVSHYDGYSTIHHNLFNYNRHSIAAAGHAESGYTAHNNVDMGQNLSDHYDMHGGYDLKNGTDIAGEYVHIYNNTYLDGKLPYNLRGRQTDKRTFEYNAVYNPREEYYNHLTHNRYTGEKLDNVEIGKNLWGISTPKPYVQVG